MAMSYICYNLNICSVLSQKLKERHWKDESEEKGKVREISSLRT